MEVDGYLHLWQLLCILGVPSVLFAEYITQHTLLDQDATHFPIPLSLIKLELADRYVHWYFFQYQSIFWISSAYTISLLSRDYANFSEGIFLPHSPFESFLTRLIISMTSFCFHSRDKEFMCLLCWYWLTITWDRKYCFVIWFLCKINVILEYQDMPAKLMFVVQLM